MMQAYLLELSAFGDEAPGADGLFDLGPRLEAYWSEAGRYALLFQVEGEIAGFCLVRQLEEHCRAIAEFYVVPRFRRSGVGAQAARTIFGMFVGRWQVGELEKNKPAQKFWRRVIGDYTSGDYWEKWSQNHPTGPMQEFVSRPN